MHSDLFAESGYGGAIRILMELGKGEKPAEQTEKAEAAQPQVFR